MSEDIKAFLLQCIEKKYPLPENCDVNTFDYFESGHVDSMGIMEFVSAIEEHFDIEISESDMISPEFRCVKGLIEIIQTALQAKNA